LEETLKTAGVGVSATMLCWMELIPPVLSILTALATLVYMILKIKNEVKK
jgi:hypothetical protein